MSTQSTNPSHEERTATEPRDHKRHNVTLVKWGLVNSSIRTFQFRIDDHKNGLMFQSGQWLDVWPPGVKKAGGFTITSIPDDAAPMEKINRTKKIWPFVELAVQKSPANPAAEYLWRPLDLNCGPEPKLQVRVGGSFVWPPPNVDLDLVKRVVFVAGGVGINPLISMLSHLHRTNQMLPEVHFLYSTKLTQVAIRNEIHPGDVLFLPKLMEMASLRLQSFHLKLFFTNADAMDKAVIKLLPEHHARRMRQEDILEVLGDTKQRRSTVCYICGPPQATDETVTFVSGLEGMEGSRVLCEKWW